MKAPSTVKPQRCAIYTRKSTDHNLDLAFNSLDAQREACEAYVRSQAHEGWRLIPQRYDDGAYSGASLERPALQALMEAISARQIDIVVVYKVDRLTRSLADFAKLVELFDAHEVSFVSVTQSFNTTSSMGRLTLNVLLSFAQFEREVIGERVRDKIAASKRKGIWVGGPVPLGYQVLDKKLQVVPEEARMVRTIFATYLQVGSIGALIAALREQGVRPKGRRLADGRIVAAEEFTRGPLGHLLRNRCYVGEISYRGEVHKGEHDAILHRELFDAVQARLSEQKVRRITAQRASSQLLKGLVFDSDGHPMSPSHTSKKGVRYRYYVSQALLQGLGRTPGAIQRVSAPDLERAVVDALRSTLSSDLQGAAAKLSDADLVRNHLGRVTVQQREIVIHPSSGANAGETTDALHVAFEYCGPSRKGVVHEPLVGTASLDEKSREGLLLAISRSRTWLDEIISGRVASHHEIAARENLAERYVRRLSLLAFLSPKIISAIADGSAPASLTVSRLTDALPHSWIEQERLLLIA